MFLRWSIRTQLVTLVLVVLLPGTALIFYNVTEDARESAEQARATLGILADQTVERLTGVTRDNELFLARIAVRPLVRALDSTNCDPVVREFTLLHPEYTTLAVRDLKGNPVCSFLQNPVGAERVRGFPWFQEGIRNGRFTVGNAFLGQQTGRWVSVLTYPLRDERGSVAGLLVLPLDLQWLQQRVSGSMPEHAVISVLDRENTILLRSLEHARWVGEKARNPHVVEETRRKAIGFVPDYGPDGVERIHAQRVVPGTGWVVSAGIPESMAFAHHRALLARNVTLALVALLLALVLAWRFGGSITAPIRGFERTAREVAGGDLAARAPGTGSAEFATVAREFNRMLDKLRSSGQALRESEATYHSLFDNMLNGIAYCRMLFENGRPQDFVYLSVNHAFEAQTGLKNVVGRKVTEVIPGIREADPGLFETYGRVAMTGQPEQFEIFVQALQLWFSISVYSPKREYFVAVFDVITERKRAEQELRDYAERLQGLSRRLIAVEEAERRNINRELHDRIGQSLGALNLNLNIIRSQLPQESLGPVSARLRDTQTLLEETAAQIRNVMADLHPPALDEYGLLAALHTYVESFGARLAVPITVQGEDLAPRLSLAAETALFRIAQGALVNAAAHARAQRIQITLAATLDRVTLTIADDGAGFDVARAGLARASWGLAIMRERAEAVGAALRIDTAPGRGTRVVVEIGREAA